MRPRPAPRARTDPQPRRRPRRARQRRRLRTRQRPRAATAGEPAAAQQGHHRAPTAAGRHHDRRRRLAALPDLGTVRSAGRRRSTDLAALTSGQLHRARPIHRHRGPHGRRRAADLGALGYVARASGIDVDARRDHPFVDLGSQTSRWCSSSGGDVLSRFRVRVREVAVSAALVATSAARLGAAPGQAARLSRTRTGIGSWVWSRAGGARIAHRVELDPAGTLSRVKVVDPSFFNWPALPGRPGRHDRSRLPAGQQELQPVLRRQRPLRNEQGAQPPGVPLPHLGSLSG